MGKFGYYIFGAVTVVAISGICAAKYRIAKEEAELDAILERLNKLEKKNG